MGGFNIRGMGFNGVNDVNENHWVYAWLLRLYLLPIIANITINSTMVINATLLFT